MYPKLEKDINKHSKSVPHSALIPDTTRDSVTVPDQPTELDLMPDKPHAILTSSMKT